MADASIVNLFLEEVTKKHAPEAKMVKKSDSKLMKVIGTVIKFFSPTFMTDYITTLGSTIYLPDNFWEANSTERALDIVAHETQHIIDFKKYGWFLMVMFYGSPQILALLSVLALGAIFSKTMLLWLLCLLFALPIPSPGRYLIERTGYRTTILFGRKVYKWTEQQMQNIAIAWIQEQLTGKWYYFAWPFKSWVEKDMKNESFMVEPRYQEISDFLKKHGFIPSTE